MEPGTLVAVIAQTVSGYQFPFFFFLSRGYQFPTTRSIDSLSDRSGLSIPFLVGPQFSVAQQFPLWARNFLFGPDFSPDFLALQFFPRKYYKIHSQQDVLLLST
jgi:hypothetical protein